MFSDMSLFDNDSLAQDFLFPLPSFQFSSNNSFSHSKRSSISHKYKILSYNNCSDNDQFFFFDKIKSCLNFFL